MKLRAMVVGCGLLFGVGCGVEAEGEPEEVLEAPWSSAPTIQRQEIVVASGPDLRVLTVSTPVSAVVRNGTAPVTATVCNNGALAAPASVLSVVLSTDATITSADPVIATDSFPALAPGACSTRTVTSTFSPAIGAYTLAAWADRSDSINEQLENNNVRVGPSVYVGSRADLTVSLVSAPPVAAPSTPFTVVAQVCNLGSAPASSTTVEVRLSLDTVINRSDVRLANVPVGTLAAGACQTVNASASGTAASERWLGLRVTTSSTEVTTANNTALGPRFAIGNGPELSVASVGASMTGGQLTATARVCNQGTAPALASQLKWVLSADAVIDAGDTLAAQVPVPALAVAACADVTGATSPAGLLGTRTVIAQVDPAGAITELLESNNTRTGPSVILGPDLTLSALGVTDPGSGLHFDLTVCNAGTVNAGPSSIRLFASLDNAAGGDVELTTVATPALVGGACVALAGTFSPPPLAPNSYYVLGTADAAGVIAELDEANNVRVGAPLGLGPDLTVSAVNGWMASNGALASSVRVCNVGNTATPPSSQVVTTVRLSSDAVAGAGDEVVDVFTQSALNVGACLDLVSSHVPVTRGLLYVLANVDEADAISERSESNNAAATTQTVTILPDFAVEALSGTLSGTTFTASITICNRGSVPSDGFAEARLDGPIPISSFLQVPVPTLAVNACATVPYPLEFFIGSNGTFTLNANTGAQTTESDYSNNFFFGPNVLVQPDFAIEALTYSLSGTTLTASITVCNRGTFPAGGFAEARLDGPNPISSFLQVPVPTLAVNACTTVPYTLEFFSGSNGTFTLNANTGAQTTESDYSNNFFFGPNVLVQPDFAVEALTYSLSGTTLTASITVCNRGTFPAGGFAEARLDGPNPISSFLQVPVPTLAVNACATVPYPLEFFSGSNGTFTLNANTGAQTTESDYSNNFFFGPNVVIP